MQAEPEGDAWALGADELAFEIEGSEEESGEVRMQTFRDILGDLYDCLRAVEGEPDGADDRLEFRIVRLEAGSARFAIRVVGRNPSRARDFARRFPRKVRQVEAGQKDPDVDWEAIERFKKLGRRVGRRTPAIRVRSAEEVVPVTAAMVVAADQMLATGIVATGSVSGRLQRINTHNQAEFYIYPLVGPRKVRCTFPPKMTSEVGGAIDAYVTVNGLLRYRPDAPFPYMVRVDAMEVHPPSESLPTLGMLIGAAPDITRGQDEITFLHELRGTA